MIFTTGTTELDLVAPALKRLAGQTVDVVVHDLNTNTSATLARLVVPVVRP